MSPEHEPGGNGREQRVSLVEGLIGIAILGLAGYGAWEGSNKLYSQVDFWLKQLSQPERPEKPVFPLDKEGKVILEFDRELAALLQKSLEAYGGWQSYGQRLQSLLHVSQPKETTQLLEQIGRNFIIEGVDVLQTAWLLGHTQVQAFIDTDQKKLWINNNHYDLSNRFEVQLAGAWVQTKTMQIDKKLQITLAKKNEDIDIRELPLQIEELQEDLELLSWLKQRNPPIEIQEETFAFFPRKEMVAVARIFQAVDKLGLGVPGKIEWCRVGCVGERAIGGAYPYLNLVKLETRAISDSLAHEIGHLIENKIGLLDKFVEVRGYKGKAQSKERLQFVSEGAMESEIEDFAETFVFFSMHGDYFRDLLEELKLHNPKTWEVLKEKYEYMRDKVWDGVEFSSKAQVRDLEKERQTQEFAGIKWSAKGHTLEIKPNPESWPGKRKLLKVYPVLVGDRLEHLGVGFNYDPKKRSYIIAIDTLNIVSKVNFFPLSGDDRALVTSFPWLKELEIGGVSLIEFIPQLDQEREGSFRFTIESFSPVVQGQYMKIRDNTPGFIALRADPTSGKESGFTYNGDPILILDGPEEAYYPYSGKVEKFWLVENLRYGWRDKGWVSERWIGPEFSQEELKNLPQF